MMMTPTTLTTVEEALRENEPNLPEKEKVTLSRQRVLANVATNMKDVRDRLFTRHGPLEDDDYKGSNALIKESKKERIERKR